MAKSVKASEVLSRMRETATRKKATSEPGEGSSVLQNPNTEEQPIKPDLRRAVGLPAETDRRVRFTLDLSREQHKFLKLFALEAETDASAVVRTLLQQLEHDAELASQVRTELSN